MNRSLVLKKDMFKFLDILINRDKIKSFNLTYDANVRMVKIEWNE